MDPISHIQNNDPRSEGLDHEIYRLMMKYDRFLGDTHSDDRPTFATLRGSYLFSQDVRCDFLQVFYLLQTVTKQKMLGEYWVAVDWDRKEMESIADYLAKLWRTGSFPHE